MKVNPKKLYALGMQPWAPRWLKMWCLRMILRYVAKEMCRVINNMTPEQRAEFDKGIAKTGSFKA